MGEEGQLKLSVSELDEVLTHGASWAVDRGFGTPEDLDYIGLLGLDDDHYTDG